MPRRNEPNRGRVTVFPSLAAAASAAAQELRARAIAATRLRGAFTLALSGGSTPEYLYRALLDPEVSDRASAVPWAATHVFWGDERTVPPDHPDSNFGAAQRSLLSNVPIPSNQVHRMRGEDEPESAALAYADELRRSCQLSSDDVPTLDLVLLGLGPDAHTASLFPASEVLTEEVRLVAAPWVPTLGAFRLTMTPVVLNRARSVLFLVTGSQKAEAVRAVLEEPIDHHRYPAQVVRPSDGDLLWLLDGAAASQLTSAARGGG